MVQNTVADIDPDRVKWKVLVPGHYIAKLGCHTEGYRGDDMGGHLCTLTLRPYLFSVYLSKVSIYLARVDS